MNLSPIATAMVALVLSCILWALIGAIRAVPPPGPALRTHGHTNPMRRGDRSPATHPNPWFAAGMALVLVLASTGLLWLILLVATHLRWGGA
jgi:hypothetical protein